MNLPAAVFQQILRTANERVDMRDVNHAREFVEAMREDAAVLGWTQLDRNDPESWERAATPTEPVTPTAPTAPPPEPPKAP